ncbi:uncharacterized protein TRIADDRAFT_51357 [Trichoplax adhaerens]|uniref:Uncharacterized protein n=1 Tax=Trichoplax adhaerens TaxID=10228 RepID=B3RIT3_TRIAD|nr:hypothetical protein TRIADDRAFT_51357 [Trichoplax adhaerens]EDV28444.1 hypothetical protein TRIADDRAFT_51357 [Trichoplax adhaerens]|eukprot:XP_002107646.1 hypothetical protein TRIADDRAFT_51357 [Trichoplax adhaerens]
MALYLFIWYNIFRYCLSVYNTKPQLQQALRQIVNVAIGNKALLVCTVSGYPQPNVTWSKKNPSTDILTTISNNNTSKYQVDRLQGYLTINGIQQEDQGIYVCIAANIYGTANGTYQVIVRHKAEIISPPKQTIVVVNNFATLACTAKGDKTVVIKWWKNNTEINQYQHSRIVIRNRVINQGNDGKLFHIKSELEIMPAVVEDNGSYTCQATNGYGVDNRQAGLIVQTKPSPPSNLQSFNVTSTSIILRWSKPLYYGHSDLTEYKIIMRSQLESVDYFSSASPDKWNTTIKSLYPGVQYIVTMQAVNSIGTSKRSQSITVNTLEAAPSEPPSSLNLESLSSQSIRVSWEPPALKKRNGILHGYRITYRAAGGIAQHLNITDKGLRSYVLVKLKSLTYYNVAIQAYNSKGISPKTVEKQVRTKEGAPTKAPTDLRLINRSSQVLTITWSPPQPEPQNYTRIITYLVIYFQIDGDIRGELRLAGNQVVAVVSGLLPYNKYQFKVLALTSGGSGPWSQPITFETDEAAPSPPILKLVNTHSQFIEVKWSEPRVIQGILRSYNICWYSYAKDHQCVSLLYINQRYTIGNLNPDQVYFIYVIAFTDAGNSDNSNIVEVRTLALAPPISGARRALQIQEIVGLIIGSILIIIIQTRSAPLADTVRVNDSAREGIRTIPNYDYQSMARPSDRACMRDTSLHLPPTSASPTPNLSNGDKYSVVSLKTTCSSDYDAGSEGVPEQNISLHPPEKKYYKRTYRPTLHEVNELSQSDEEASPSLSPFPTTSYPDLVTRTTMNNRYTDCSSRGHSPSNGVSRHFYESIPQSYFSPQQDDQQSIGYVSDTRSTVNNCGSDNESRFGMPELLSASDYSRFHVGNEGRLPENTRILSQNELRSATIASAIKL